MGKRTFLAVAAAIVVLSTAVSSSAAPAPPTNSLITYNDLSPIESADGSASRYSVSDDGSKIAFDYNHTNDADVSDDLGLPLTNAVPSATSIFLYNRESKVLSLVNHAFGSATTTDNAGAFAPAVSGDGNWVAFVSNGTNLVEDFVDDTNANSIYLLNVNTGAITLVTRKFLNTSAEANGAASSDIAINADGSKIAFRSRATDMVPGFTDNSGANNGDVFIWTRDTNAIGVVSHHFNNPAQGGDSTIDLFSERPIQISDDGRYVAYTSNATNLVNGFDDNNGPLEDMYLYDAATGTNTLVTHGATPVEGADGEVMVPALAANGSRIAYESKAQNLVTAFVDNNAANTDVFVWSRSSNSARLVSFSAIEGKKEGAGPTGGFSGSTPLISANGKTIAYESDANDLIKGHVDGFNGQDDIWLWTEKLRNGKKVYANALVTRNYATPKQSHFTPPNHMSSLSEDGKRVVFQSGDTTSIVEGFVNNNGSNHDVFVYDAQTKKASVVSHAFGAPLEGSNGPGTSAPSVGFGAKQILSSNGKVIPFTSNASNLLSSFSDGNGVLSDLYVYGPPVS